MASVQPLSSLQNSSRHNVLDGLNKFIERSEAKLEEVLLKIGWTRDSLKDTAFVTCPVDSRHSVPEDTLTRHIDRCQWGQEGYSRAEYVNTPSSSFFYQNTDTVFSLKLEQAKQSEVLTSVTGVPTLKPVPRTPARARSDFTQAEKLALYDHVVAESRKSRRSSLSVKVLSEIGEDAETAGSSSKNVSVKSETRQLTRLEALKQMRDYKRRRQSYRAKNVHITKRSQTDIMREIIANQMEELETERRASATIGETHRSRLKREEYRERNSRPSPSLVDGPTSHSTYYQQHHQEDNDADQRPRDSRREDRLIRSEKQGGGMSEGSMLSHDQHEEIGNRYVGATLSSSRDRSASQESDQSQRGGSLGERDRLDGGRSRNGSRSPSVEKSRHRHKHSQKHKKHKKGSH